jgi:ABC-type long-subunit fatty acid transport system fused permease/ATPase subunit
MFSVLSLVEIEVSALVLASVFTWLGIRWQSAGCFYASCFAFGGMALTEHVISILHPTFSTHYIFATATMAMLVAFLQAAFVLQECTL